MLSRPTPPIPTPATHHRAASPTSHPHTSSPPFWLRRAPAAHPHPHRRLHGSSPAPSSPPTPTPTPRNRRSIVCYRQYGFSVLQDGGKYPHWNSIPSIRRPIWLGNWIRVAITELEWEGAFGSNSEQDPQRAFDHVVKECGGKTVRDWCPHQVFVSIMLAATEVGFAHGSPPCGCCNPRVFQGVRSFGWWAEVGGAHDIRSACGGRE